MFSFFRRWFVTILVLASAGVIAFVGGFLQEFHGRDLDERASTLGIRLPLKDPRLEVSCFRFAVELWDGDTLVKRYEAGFGRSPVCGRVGKDLASTPMGEYEVIRKEIREDILNRGSRFLQLDYPNSGDAQRGLESGILARDEYERIVAADRAGDPPPYDTALGGPLGIQGNYFFFRERHYTDGSVAISNADINELFDHVPIGTPVIIHE
jgi:hypothetical protein